MHSGSVILLRSSKGLGGSERCGLFLVFLAERRFRCRTFKGTHVHQATLFTHHLRLILLAAVIGARALPVGVAHAGESQKISPHMHYGGGTMVEACDSETNDSTTFILF